MTEDSDRLLQRLAALHPIAPDEQWQERVRARCHAEMARRQAPPQRPTRVGLLDAAAVGLLSIYLAVVLQLTARFIGLL